MHKSSSIREYIRESNLIEGIDADEEIAQSMMAWSYLVLQQKLTHPVICHVQRMITVNQTDLAPHERGYYRDAAKVNVTVGNYLAPNYTLVKPLMDNWLLDYTDLKPMEAHCRFEAVHPFVDGNGRTGRMLLWWQEIKNGETPTLVKDSEKQTYYKMLSNHHKRKRYAV